MKYYGFIFLLMIFLITAGCTEFPGASGTPAPPGGSVSPAVTASPENIPGQDPLIRVWRISNSQGYDDRFRFSADGSFVESFYDVSSKITQIHSGTWKVQEANSYVIYDTTAGKSRTLAYDPEKKTIHFTALPHLILTPYAGDVAAGIAFTTIVPTKTAVQTPAGSTTGSPAGSTSVALAIPSPITFRGVGSDMVYFETKAPGKVKFKIYYNLSEGENLKCTDEVTRFQLAGTSVDTALYYGKVYQIHDAIHTMNLLSPGRYSITVRGCWGWNILVDNA